MYTPRSATSLDRAKLAQAVMFDTVLNRFLEVTLGLSIQICISMAKCHYFYSTIKDLVASAVYRVLSEP